MDRKRAGMGRGWKATTVRHTYTYRHPSPGISSLDTGRICEAQHKGKQNIS